MDFGDERYVRLYTRDTATWKLLSEEAKCLMPLLLRKADRAGVIEFGGAQMADAIAATVDLPRLRSIVEAGLEDLADRGVIEIHRHWIVFLNFIEAQEAKSSEKARAREYRARRRDQARLDQRAEQESVTRRDESSRNVTETKAVTESASVTPRDEPSRNVTEHVEGSSPRLVTRRDASSRGVTNRHKTDEIVTPSLAEPSLAKPSLAVPTYDVVSRPSPSSQPARATLADSGDIPPRPVRRVGPMDPKVHVTEWEPHPDGTAYAAALGLTDQEFQTTVLELKSRLRTDRGHVGFFDDRFCSFLEARANGGARGKRSRSRAATKKGTQTKQSNEIDLSKLDDEDREFFGDFLEGLD